MAINLGSYLSLPHESPNAIIWRIAQCNPSLKRSHWTTMFKHSISDNTQRFKKHLNLDNLRVLDYYCRDLTVEELDELSSLSLPNSISQCPKCAEVLYHSSAFDQRFVKRCPIHKTRLTNKCPACKNYWPQGLDIVARQCALCGVKNDHYQFVELRNKFQNKNFKFFHRVRTNVFIYKLQRVSWLWWDCQDWGYEYKICRADAELRNDYYVSASRYYGWHHNKNPDIPLGYPEEFKQWTLKAHDRLSDDIRNANIRQGFQRSMKQHKNYLEKHHCLRLKLPSFIVNARMDVINDIYQKLSQIHPHNHSLVRVQQQGFKSLDKDCPYCLVYSNWLTRLLAYDIRQIPSYSMQENHKPFYYFWGLNHRCVTPMPWRYIQAPLSNHRGLTIFTTHKIPSDMQAYLYKAELYQLFRDIYFYVTKYYQFYLYNDGKPAFYLEFKEFLRQKESHFRSNIRFFLGSEMVYTAVSKNLLAQNFHIKAHKVVDNMLDKQKMNANLKSHTYGLTDSDQFNLHYLIIREYYSAENTYFTFNKLQKGM